MRSAMLLVAVAAAGAMGQPIAVTNPGFEAPALNPNGFTQPSTAVPGWTQSGGGSGDWGVFYPTMATWQYTAPEGNQLLYTNGPAVEQTLATTAVAGQSYTLRVDVVRRPGFGGNPYFIELYAGTVLLARDDNSLLPAVGGFLTSTLTTTAPGPAAGQALRIRLGGASQTNFDRVRLERGSCYANCDGSATPPVLNVQDFSCFLNSFASGGAYANCDGSTTPPVLNVQDFSCFLNRFASGCS